MLTRRAFHTAGILLYAAAYAGRASAQQGDTVTVLIRADESVRGVIPPIVQRNLRIERDESDEAKELIRRAPPERAVPIIFIIAGAMAVPVVLQMVREALRHITEG
jgi:hypothetical protein